MKRLSRIHIGLLIAILALSCICCACQKDGGTDYSDYMGKQYSGADPWGNSLSVELKSMEGEEVSFGYESIIGEDEYMCTLQAEATGELTDGSIPFHITSTAKENDAVHMDYSGSLTLKDGMLYVTYDDGQVNEDSSEGGSAGYQALALNEEDKTVELTEKK